MKKKKQIHHNRNKDDEDILKKIIYHIDKEMDKIQDKRQRIINKYRSIEKIPHSEMVHVNVGMITFLRNIKNELREEISRFKKDEKTNKSNPRSKAWQIS
jgi:hypothetical protein